MGIFNRKPNIRKLKERRDVEGLIRALKYKDEAVQSEAADALANVGEPAVGPLIRTLTKDPDIGGYFTTRALAETGSKRALEGLIKVLEDKGKDKVMRGNTASAIRSFKRKTQRLTAIEPLARALYDPSTYVRWQSARALSTIRDAKAIRHLMKGVMDKNPDIREDIVVGIRQEPPELFLSTIKELRPTLGNEPEDCCAVARLLILFGPSEDESVEKETKKAIKKSPNYAPAHHLLGFLRLRRASWSDDQKSKKAYSNQALKEFEVAIKLDPKEPEPYYEISDLPSLSFPERKKYYEKALKLDSYKSKAFGWNHWGYAMKASEEGARGLSVDAFTRAIIVDPGRFKEGPISVRPAGGSALVWWNAAKDELKHYQDPKSIEMLWKGV